MWQPWSFKSSLEAKEPATPCPDLHEKHLAALIIGATRVHVSVLIDLIGCGLGQFGLMHPCEAGPTKLSHVGAGAHPLARDGQCLLVLLGRSEVSFR